MKELHVTPAELEFVSVYLLGVLRKIPMTELLARTLKVTLLGCSTNLCAQCFNDLVNVFLFYGNAPFSPASKSVAIVVGELITTVANYIADEYPDCVLVNVPTLFSKMCKSTEVSPDTWKALIKGVETAL